MTKYFRIVLAAGLVALWIVSGSAFAQSPNTYTSIVVTDITSGAPVVGGFFTTLVNVSVANSGGGTPTAVQGVEAYIGFDPSVVNVVDFDNNPTNGTQVEIKAGFFTTISTGINRVETPCPGTTKPSCIHIALTQTTGGVTNGSGIIASIRWIGVAPGAAGISVEVPPTVLSDPNGQPVTINNAGAPSITVLPPGAIMGGVTRQGRAANQHAGTSVLALNPAGSLVAGPVTTADSGAFVSPLAVPAGGTYTVVASYPGYLAAQKSSVYIVGATVNIGTTQLRGGDVNGDNCINIFDLATMASWFSSAAPPAPAPVDVNDDGVINIFDMAIGASNFSRCGPTTW